MIKVENLSYSYEDGYEALKNINVDGNKGEIIGFIGCNGAGKSTLFLSIMKILNAKVGEIYYKGEKVRNDKKYLREYRQKVGVVFQDPDKQIFYSNIYDDIAFSLRNLGFSEDVIKERVEYVVRRLGMEDFYEKPVHFLSLGQKKRVAIAGVLAMECELFLMDEPTAGLDPKITEEIVKIIVELKDRGKKIFISSHDMELIYRICDYVYVMNNGSIIDEGITKELFERSESLEKASLKAPWIVRLHKECSIPLFAYEEELVAFIKKLS